MSTIAISFIIPCYNCSKTLSQAIDSIIALNLKKYQICMVDDASTDGTHNVIQKYAEKYPDIISMDRNKKIAVEEQLEINVLN